MPSVGDLFIMIHPNGDQILMRIDELVGEEFRAAPATQDEADAIAADTLLPHLDMGRDEPV